MLMPSTRTISRTIQVDQLELNGCWEDLSLLDELCEAASGGGIGFDGYVGVLADMNSEEALRRLEKGGFAIKRNQGDWYASDQLLQVAGKILGYV
jgi:hypothetical protein